MWMPMRIDSPGSSSAELELEKLSRVYDGSIASTNRHIAVWVIWVSFHGTSEIISAVTEVGLEAL